jgi:hypothetical protein
VFPDRQEDFEVLLQEAGRREAVLHLGEKNHRDVLLQTCRETIHISYGGESSSVVLLQVSRHRLTAYFLISPAT